MGREEARKGKGCIRMNLRGQTNEQGQGNQTSSANELTFFKNTQEDFVGLMG